jgi:hypothetical protein
MYFNNCKTLDEAKKLFYTLCMKLHPDKGGKHDDFIKMKSEFDSFKPECEKFNGELDKWDSEEFGEIIEQLINIQGIEIEICGSWIWIGGDTKPVKEEIKAVNSGETYKRGFSKSKMKWYFSPKGYKKRSKSELGFDEIRDLYGSQKVKRQGREQIAA